MEISAFSCYQTSLGLVRNIGIYRGAPKAVDTKGLLHHQCKWCKLHAFGWNPLTWAWFWPQASERPSFIIIKTSIPQSSLPPNSRHIISFGLPDQLCTRAEVTHQLCSRHFQLRKKTKEQPELNLRFKRSEPKLHRQTRPNESQAQQRSQIPTGKPVDLPALPFPLPTHLQQRLTRQHGGCNHQLRWRGGVPPGLPRPCQRPTKRPWRLSSPCYSCPS